MAEKLLQEVRVRGVDLESHDAGAGWPPPSFRLDPAEVVYAHAFGTVPAYALIIARALCAKVHVGRRVREYAQRRQEVIIRAGPARRHARRAHEPRNALRRQPVNEDSLHGGAAIDHQHVLRCDLLDADLA